MGDIFIKVLIYTIVGLIIGGIKHYIDKINFGGKRELFVYNSREKTPNVIIMSEKVQGSLLMDSYYNKKRGYFLYYLIPPFRDFYNYI
jgi:hypothetical protein